MYKAIENIHFYNSVMNQYSNYHNKNLILEPLSCALKLSILQFKEAGTKISIIDNSIYFNEPRFSQGLLRLFSGDSREDLHNLYNPLLKCVEWYPIKENKQIYEECIKGLHFLNKVYDSNTTIHHTINHYISILNESSINKIQQETNPIIDKLKDIWTKEEIKAINDLIDLIKNNKNKNIYIKSLEDIVSAKEIIVNKYIKKMATSY